MADNFYSKYSGVGTSGVVSVNSINGAVNIVAGSGISVTPAGQNITIAATGGSGTVTSVALADSTGIFNITGSPVTTSGTLTLASLNSQLANRFLAAPNGSNGAPTFRAIVAADIPTLNQNTTGTASNVTGTVAVANGGTGQTTYTNGQLLIGNTTGNTLAKSTLTAGTGISITNGTGSITIASTVTSGANTALSNLTTTSINQSLLFNANNTYDVGSPSGILANTYTNSIRGGGNYVIAVDTGQLLNNGLTSIDWSSSLLVDSSGSATSVNYDSRVLYDASAVISMDWNNRRLNNAANAVVMDYSAGLKLNDSTGNISLDASDREAYDSTGNLAISYNQRKLKDASEVDSVLWDARQLMDTTGTGVSVDYSARQLLSSSGVVLLEYGSAVLLYDASAQLSLNAHHRRLINTTGIITVNWNSNRLTDSTGVLSFDWEARQAYDNTNVLSADFQGRTLQYPSGVTAIDYGSGVLADSTGVLSIDYNVNRVIASPDASTSIDYSSNDRVTFSKVIRLFNAAADPGTASAGDCYFNTTLNKIKVYNGTTWETVVSA